MRRRLAALLGAGLLSLAIGQTAIAAVPAGTVTIQSEGCTFSVTIDLEMSYDLIGWKVKEYNAANWNEGLTLFKGSGPTDATGGLVVGPFTAPEGHYNVAVDDEYPPDGSSIVQDFVLSCPAPALEPAPPSGGGEQPVELTPPTETGTELPIEGTPPNGAVGGVSMTPPPTDTGMTAGTTSDAGLLPALLGIFGVVMAVALVASPRWATSRATAKRRR